MVYEFLLIRNNQVEAAKLAEDWVNLDNFMNVGCFRQPMANMAGIFFKDSLLHGAD